MSTDAKHLELPWLCASAARFLGSSSGTLRGEVASLRRLGRSSMVCGRSSSCSCEIDGHQRVTASHPAQFRNRANLLSALSLSVSPSVCGYSGSTSPDCSTELWMSLPSRFRFGRQLGNGGHPGAILEGQAWQEIEERIHGSGETRPGGEIGVSCTQSATQWRVKP